MWPNPPETVDLVTFTEQIFNGELHFLWSDHEVECTGVEKIINELNSVMFIPQVPLS